MIFQDAAGFVANPGKEGYVPNAFDTLIASGEMPVTIGLFINPGLVPVPRFNRSFEYDGMGPNYAHFLIKEMRPLVGKNYSISTNPDDRALCLQLFACHLSSVTLVLSP
jgi:gluconolactonase